VSWGGSFLVDRCFGGWGFVLVLGLFFFSLRWGFVGCAGAGKGGQVFCAFFLFTIGRCGGFGGGFFGGGVGPQGAVRAFLVGFASLGGTRRLGGGWVLVVAPVCRVGFLRCFVWFGGGSSQSGVGKRGVWGAPPGGACAGGGVGGVGCWGRVWKGAPLLNSVIIIDGGPGGGQPGSVSWGWLAGFGAGGVVVSPRSLVFFIGGLFGEVVFLSTLASCGIWKCGGGVVAVLGGGVLFVAVGFGVVSVRPGGPVRSGSYCLMGWVWPSGCRGKGGGRVRLPMGFWFLIGPWMRFNDLWSVFCLGGVWGGG